MRYAVVIEKAEDRCTVRVPDLPACTAEGATPAAAMAEIRNVIRKHLTRLERDGLPAPEPSTVVEYVEA
jgi:predicted RNase H-like HicB family nuclease